MMMTLSCTKENQLPTLSKKGGNESAHRLAPEELEAVTNDFITQSLSGNWNLGNYEFEDVTLMLEGALNYRTCKPHEYYDEIATDSASFELPIYQDTDDNWYVDAERTIELWNNLLEHANAVPERLGNGNYFNIVADLEIAEVDYQSSKIVVSVVVWAGLATLYPIPFCDFTSNDYWWSIFSPNAPGCSSNSTNTSSNAFKEIIRRINSGACFGSLEYGYFLNVTTLGALAFDGYGTIYNCEPCSGINWAWIGSAPNTIDCLSPYEMDCYTNSIHCVGMGISNQLGKNLISVNLQGFAPGCQSCYDQWKANYLMGNLVVYSND
jgi:hypothetical protein